MIIPVAQSTVSWQAITNYKGAPEAIDRLSKERIASADPFALAVVLTEMCHWDFLQSLHHVSFSALVSECREFSMLAPFHRIEIDPETTLISGTLFDWVSAVGCGMDSSRSLSCRRIAEEVHRMFGKSPAYTGRI